MSAAGANKGCQRSARTGFAGASTSPILPRCTRPSSDDLKPIESRSKADRRPIEGRSKADRRPIEGRSKADFSALKLDRSPTGCRSRPQGKPISIRFREKPHSTPTQHPLSTHSTPIQHSLSTHSTPTRHPLDTHSTLTQHPLDTHSAPVTLQPKCSIATEQDMRCTCTSKPAQSQRPALACTCGAHGCCHARHDHGHLPAGRLFLAWQVLWPFLKQCRLACRLTHCTSSVD